jgi:hypothetical protein
VRQGLPQVLKGIGLAEGIGSHGNPTFQRRYMTTQYCMDYAGHNYNIPNDLVAEFYALNDRIEELPSDTDQKLDAEEKFRLFIQNMNR